jgi:hypothetical protein
VIAARCAGLDDLEARLLSGRRPSHARLLPGEYLPLPPCDTERCSYVQLGDGLRWELRDARALVGHAQPAPLAADAPTVRGGLALVLADDLWRATAREAARAILGYTAVLDWGGAAHLGPDIHTRLDLRALDPATYQPSEQVAFASQQLQLRAGDVIGLCPLWSRAAKFGERVDVWLDRALHLEGWVTEAPAPADWRL